MVVSVNLLVVIVTALVGFGIGGLWYSPLFFGKRWMSLKKIQKPKNTNKNIMISQYVAQAVITLVTAYILAVFVSFSGAIGFSSGALIGFLAWLGFAATTLFTATIWEKTPIQLYLIDTGYYLVGYVIMAGILAAWV